MHWTHSIHHEITCDFIIATELACGQKHIKSSWYISNKQYCLSASFIWPRVFDPHQSFLNFIQTWVRYK